MILPLIPQVGAVLSRFFQDLFLELIREDERNRKIGKDIVLAQGERIIIKDSAGAKWAVVVDTSGNLSTVAA